jgi:hypothetical protein
MYQSARTSDEDVASLVESHTFVDVQNQHGEQVQLSFCMDGWSLLVKDEKELQFEAMLRAKRPKSSSPRSLLTLCRTLRAGRLKPSHRHRKNQRTFATYIARVAAILAANPSMVLVLDEEHGATLNEGGNLYGFMLKEPRDESSYEFDPRAWAEDRWDCSLSSRPGGARTANPDAPQPGSCPAPCERQSWAGGGGRHACSHAEAIPRVES